jgi:pyridoxine 4-dehydrogenase
VYQSDLTIHILLICGTSSDEHLRENVKAASLQLPLETAAKLDAIGINKA